METRQGFLHCLNTMKTSCFHTDHQKGRKCIKRSVEFTTATPSMEPRPSTSYDPEPFTSFKATDSLTPIAESVDEGSSIDFGGEDVPSVSQTTLPNYTMGAQTEAEIYFLRKENEELKAKLEKRLTSFSFDEIKNDDKLINMYTGLPNAYIFEATYSLFENMPLNYVQGWTVGKIAKQDQFLLTLMKLRLNILHNDLACSFSTFTNCRIVLDCTEVKCARPSSLEKQRFTCSSYKHFNTVKGLVGVAPNGVITFISELYPGSVSDKKIVQDSAILNKMSSGDLILADKGFLIADILPQGVSLNVPPFLTTWQFTPQQVVQTRTIACARIHVERAIGRMKCFLILNSIPQNLLPQATKIFQVCGALTNLQFPLIAEVENLYEQD
nr:unnamed protein product [Callosobruchus analis]